MCVVYPWCDRRLEELNLSDNQLAELSGLVDMFPGLQILDVSRNLIQDTQQLVSYKNYY